MLQLAREKTNTSGAKFSGSYTKKFEWSSLLGSYTAEFQNKLIKWFNYILNST